MSGFPKKMWPWGNTLKDSRRPAASNLLAKSLFSSIRISAYACYLDCRITSRKLEVTYSRLNREDKII
jgi:hypothetical protein